jgi:two-component system, OmpR family, response regulator
MAQAAPNILVVEDDRETRSLIAKYLRSNACNVATAADGREMARAMTDRRVDLLILDVMLPGEDGLSLCRKVQAQSQTPTIMLTARGEDVDRILGLEMGADDYLAKPFNPRELLARIKAVLRRANSLPPQKSAQRNKAVSFDRWTLDVGRRELIGGDGVAVPLSTAEFRLLCVLVERPGLVLTRDQLLDLTVGRAADVYDRSIDNQVSRLRKKIELDPRNPALIKTHWGGGYSFTAEVTPA